MLKIKNWLERLESQRDTDRPRKSMDWLFLPCDLQSTGYGLLMQEEKGPQHLGVFVAVLEVVADLPKTFRGGSLVNAQGDELSLQALSIKTRISQACLEESIEALSRCGWLQEEESGEQEDPYAWISELEDEVRYGPAGSLSPEELQARRQRYKPSVGSAVYSPGNLHDQPFWSVTRPDGKMYLIDAVNGEISLGTEHSRKYGGLSEDLLYGPEKRPGPWEALSAREKEQAHAFTKALHEVREEIARRRA
jgi:hypothetical protein